VISSNEESNEELAAPLLLSEVDEFGEQLSTGLLRMETGAGTVGNVETDQNSIMLNSGPMSHPTVRHGVFWLLSVRTAADALPTVFQAVATSGKYSIFGFVGFYLFFIALWLPFWLLSFLVYEWGVYSLAFVTVFLVGRAIIRLIAFPGSSQRVSTEIETEFAKYSVRMLISSCNSLIDLGSAIVSTSNSSAQSPNSGNGDGSTQNNPSFAYYELPGLWKRAKSYRDRVLGVYSDVLIFLLRRSESPATGPLSDLTKYGNNLLKGDLGNLSGLTVSLLVSLSFLVRSLWILIIFTLFLSFLARSSNGRARAFGPLDQSAG
jgi:hypothetical protein